MTVITTTTSLAHACQRLARHPFVTVDTEFLREETYWPELCLIQMAGPEDELIVDPLAKGIELGPFFELMADQRWSRCSTPAARTSRSSMPRPS